MSDDNENEQPLNLDIPDHLEYSEEHAWVDRSVDPAIIGITEYAADQLGELVFVDLPEPGARVEAGDEIVAVNGRHCFVANDIIYELVRTEQYRADFTVLRDGQTVELPDVQFDTWTDEAGQVHMSLGFTVYGLAKTPRNVLREAGNSMLYYGRIIFTSLADLLRGRESINNLSGPVGIVTAIGQAASYGWQDLLQMLALITINLGILNLLPFPALDGGKVVFLAIEGITGHAVPEKLQGSLIVAAFALLFGLMIFATYNDIIRLITGAV